MKDVYILDCSRTAVGSFGGTLSNIHPANFAKDVIVDLNTRNNIAPEEIDEVILGNVLGAGLGQNVARQAAIYSGIP
ncbi:MAG: acetyl-CoA C-acyltransferase, partial [Spirochaetales bacterium]|nr:acetyl-CoA C-acyltransferase [Spirochaetales bacterium]MDC7228456.1 acetyl-CoA C-acyltransferase [Spirochaetales bacterium]